MSGNGVGDELLGDELFAKRSAALSDAIGVLLKIPELREQLVVRLDAAESEGDFLSRVVKDWVGPEFGGLAGSW